MEFDSGLTVLAALFRLIFTYGAIRLDTGLSGILYAMVASQVVYLIGGVLIGHLKFCKAAFKKDVALWKFLILQSLPIGASGFFNTMYHQMNTLFLTGFRTTVEVGLYNGPYRIIRQLLFIPMLLMRAPFPIVSRLYHISPNSLPVVAEQLFKLSLTLGLPLGVILMVLADKLILLVLGPHFLNGTFVVQYFSPVVAMMFPAMFAAFLLLAMDRQGLVAVIAGACVIINAGLDILLVPLFGGIGACAATLIATASMFGVLISYVCKSIHPLSFRRIALEPFLATSVLVCVLFLLKPYGLAGVLVVGGFLYAGMVTAMIRFFSRRDLSAFREAIRQI
jgi:O-antigen/teichoic acid export membrane protein